MYYIYLDIYIIFYVNELLMVKYFIYFVFLFLLLFSIMFDNQYLYI